MTEVNEVLLDVYGEASDLYKRVYTELHTINDMCRRGGSGPQIVDAVYVLKQVVKFTEEIRKEVNRSLDTLCKLGCVVSMQTLENKISGELASGYGDSSTELIVPDREEQPAEYAALMSALGVPPDVALNPNIKPSWTATAEVLSKLQSEGKPMPAGLEHARVIPKFNIVARPKHGADMMQRLLEGKRARAKH